MENGLRVAKRKSGKFDRPIAIVTKVMYKLDDVWAQY